MGILTIGEICDEVRLATGVGIEADWPDTRIQAALNWTIMHLSSPKVYRHKELEDERTIPLVAGTSTYLVNIIDNLRTRSLYNLAVVSPTDPTDRWPLHPLNERKAHDMRGRYQAERPRWWSMWGTTQVELLPTPSTAYDGWNLSVRRLIVPVPINVATDASSTHPFADDWDEAVVLGTIWRTWRTKKDWKQAELCKAEFGQLVNEIKDRLQLEAEAYDGMVDLYNPPIQ